MADQNEEQLALIPISTDIATQEELDELERNVQQAIEYRVGGVEASLSSLETSTLGLSGDEVLRPVGVEVRKKFHPGEVGGLTAFDDPYMMQFAFAGDVSATTLSYKNGAGEEAIVADSYSLNISAYSVKAENATAYSAASYSLSAANLTADSFSSPFFKYSSDGYPPSLTANATLSNIQAPGLTSDTFGTNVHGGLTGSVSADWARIGEEGPNGSFIGIEISNGNSSISVMTVKAPVVELGQAANSYGRDSFVLGTNDYGEVWISAQTWDGGQETGKTYYLSGFAPVDPNNSMAGYVPVFR